MNRFENEVDPSREFSRFDTILAEQISRYPLLQVQDLYKLIHQGAMGSEHAIRDAEAAHTWLEEELDNLQEGPPEPMVDPISPSGDIVRINLRPYLQDGRNPRILLDAFIRTANEYRGSEELLRKCWAHARRMASEGKLPLDIRRMDEFMSEMEKQGLPAVHHSLVYEEAFRPAYRVVAAIYMREFLDE